MKDKYLLRAEIDLIRSHLPKNSKMLDVGCGEGESTWVYSLIPGICIHAADFSKLRLRKASRRLAKRQNVEIKNIDFLREHPLLDKNYDVILCQRFLINLADWGLQKKVLLRLIRLLRPKGCLILLEGSRQGTAELDHWRNLIGLKNIPVRWHNLFLNDSRLENFLRKNGLKLLVKDGLGCYFLLTRGIRPYFTNRLNWKCAFNRIAASLKARRSLNIDNEKFSRLKLWVFEK